MAAQTQISPIYHQCFHNPFETLASPDWGRLNSTPADLTAPLASRVVDFSVQDKTQGWSEMAQRIMRMSLKAVLFPWGLYELTRYAVQRLVMLPLYPAQSFILKKGFLSFYIGAEALDLQRCSVAFRLGQRGFIVRHAALEKNGVRYSGLLIGHESTIHNGRWALQATGNLELIEYSAEELASIYQEMKFNVLLINGPGVGRSEGEAGAETMGEAQELGLRFLEEAVNARHIVIAGRSLGGAAVGQAILQHEFKENVRYLAVRQMTFDRVSTICSKTAAQIFPMVEELVRKIVLWAGCEIDSVAASKKLQQLGIKEVVVQCTNSSASSERPAVGEFETDGPILAAASLGRALIEEKIVDNKVFIGLPFAHHMTNSAISAPQEEIQRLCLSALQ